MLHPLRWHALGCALLLTLLPALSVHAQGDDEALYRDTIKEAVVEFQAGHWQEAVALFKRAHGLKPSAKTARGLGLAYFEARKYTLAVELLQQAKELDADVLSADQRRSVDDVLERALRFTSILTLEVTPEDAEIQVDGRVLAAGQHALRVDAGKHEVWVRSAGYQPAELTLSTEGGADRTVPIELAAEGAAGGAGGSVSFDAQSPSAAPAVLRTLGWVTGGLAVAGGVTTLVLWRLKEDGPAADYVAMDCGNMFAIDPCPQLADEDENYKSAMLTVGLASAGLAATAATLFIVAEVLDTDVEEAPLACTAGPTGVLCGGRF